MWEPHRASRIASVSTQASCIMQFVVFALLGLIALGFVLALIVGFTLKLAGLMIMALLVVAVVSFVMRKIRGPRRPLSLDHPADAERLPR